MLEHLSCCICLITTEDINLINRTRWLYSRQFNFMCDHITDVSSTKSTP